MMTEVSNGISSTLCPMYWKTVRRPLFKRVALTLRKIGYLWLISIKTLVTSYNLRVFDCSTFGARLVPWITLEANSKLMTLGSSHSRKSMTNFWQTVRMCKGTEVVMPLVKVKCKVLQNVTEHTGVKTHLSSRNSLDFDWFWHFKNVNFVKNEISEKWILWKRRLQKCEFREKWDFRNVNVVKIEISEMRILWKLRFQKGEFCENWDLRNVNLVKNEISERWICH